jgi:hypothetical protein
MKKQPPRASDKCKAKGKNHLGFSLLCFVLRECGGNFFHERKTSQRPVATEIFRKRNITVPPAPPSKKHLQKYME